LLPNNTASGTFLHKSGAVRSVDWIFMKRVGASLAVTGRIQDIGQNILKSSLQTGSKRILGYFHSFITFLEEAFIRKIITL